jgi:SAM-dependent methyltransferase
MTTADDYDTLYQDTPPWEIGRPQPALLATLDQLAIGPTVLDLGCGTGELALTLARRGHDVTGIDISPVAIARARAKAAADNLTVHFEVQDATRLTLPPADTLIDSGLLHNLARHSTEHTVAYLTQLPALAAPGATLLVLAVSTSAGQGWGLTRQFLHEAFPAPTWTGTQITDIDITATTDGQEFTLRGLLLHTHRQGLHPVRGYSLTVEP